MNVVKNVVVGFLAAVGVVGILVGGYTLYQDLAFLHRARVLNEQQQAIRAQQPAPKAVPQAPAPQAQEKAEK